MLRADFIFVVATAVLSVLLAGGAAAAPINDRAGPVALYKNANEDDLQTILDSLTVSGGLDTVADQSSAAIFTRVGDQAVATFMIEVAGYADGNQFGLYSYLDPSNTALIFDGGNTSADQVTVSFVETALGTSVYVNDREVATDFGNDFGFYIHTKAGDWFYSEDELNGGQAQVLIYEGSGGAGGTTFVVGGTSVALDEDAVLVAFEDLRLRSSDRDYQDLVVIVDQVRTSNPAPEPGSALVFGAGLLIVSRALRGRGRQ